VELLSGLAVFLLTLGYELAREYSAELGLNDKLNPFGVAHLSNSSTRWLLPA